MPRLFTGLALPPEAANALAGLRGGLPGATWIEPADYHITLRFIGDVGFDLANEIAEGLNTIRRREIAIVIDALGVFGADRPRALFARVVTNEPLAALQADHERLMRRLGVAPELRKFLPHVTLARLRGPSMASDIAPGAFLSSAIRSASVVAGTSL